MNTKTAIAAQEAYLDGLLDLRLNLLDPISMKSKPSAKTLKPSTHLRKMIICLP